MACITSDCILGMSRVKEIGEQSVPRFTRQGSLIKFSVHMEPDVRSETSVDKKKYSVYTFHDKTR